MLEREPHASWGEGEFAPAPGPCALWNIMWNKTGRRVHSPWHSHPGVPKRREYSHRPRSHGHKRQGRASANCHLGTRAIGDRRVRLLTVNLNADESKPGSCAVRGKAAAEPSENREISQTCDRTPRIIYTCRTKMHVCATPCGPTTMGAFQLLLLSRTRRLCARSGNKPRMTTRTRRLG